MPEVPIHRVIEALHPLRPAEPVSDNIRTEGGLRMTGLMCPGIVGVIGVVVAFRFQQIDELSPTTYLVPQFPTHLQTGIEALRRF